MTEDQGERMDLATQSPSLDEIQHFLDAGGKDAVACSPALLFLYKEILVNRMMILEMKPHDNTPNISHYEKLINQLNEKLMTHGK